MPTCSFWNARSPRASRSARAARSRRATTRFAIVTVMRFVNGLARRAMQKWRAARRALGHTRLEGTGFLSGLGDSAWLLYGLARGLWML